MNHYLESLIIRYLSTGNIIIDSLLMYIFIEYISALRFRYIFNNFHKYGYNYMYGYLKKRKYKTVILTKRRIKLISSKFGIDSRYETSKEIDAVINYVSKNTKVNHYEFYKDSFNMERSIKNNVSDGYLEPSESIYNIVLKPFTDDKNHEYQNKDILLDIIIDKSEKGSEEQHNVYECNYKLYSDDIKVLSIFINKCVKEYDEHLEQQTSITKYYCIYQGECESRYREREENTYITFPLILSKSFDNIFLPEKSKLQNDLDFFINNQRRF